MMIRWWEITRDSKRFLVQPGVGVDHQKIKLQRVDQLTESLGQAFGVISLPQCAGNFTWLGAGGNQKDFARDVPGRHVDRGLLDLPAVPEKVVQGNLNLVPLQSKKNVDSRRLDVGIDDPHTLTLRSEGNRQICRRVRLAGTTTEGVNRDDLCQGTPRGLAYITPGLDHLWQSRTAGK